ncbi:MAG: hypothetical protein JWM47_199 [Acidimicrobiales bacterium]|nr:hypothetical protein [Acidimicrobiales bacterium]
MRRNAEDATGKAETDLGQAELIDSAGVQNSVAVAGPGALVMIPLAWALTSVSRILRRLWNS